VGDDLFAAAAEERLARPAPLSRSTLFIARRLVILSSEDVGEADPLGLVSPPPPPTRSSTSACRRPS
jgi:hypothetical protein